MKRTIAATLFVILCMSTLAAPEAGAGFLDKWLGKDKETKAAPRYDLFPELSFFNGVLGRGIGQAWQVDDTDLQVRQDCVVTSEFRGEAALEEGREVLVMGTKVGETIIAYRVRIVKPDYMNQGMPNSSEVIPSEVDPTVGVGTGPE